MKRNILLAVIFVSTIVLIACIFQLQKKPVYKTSIQQKTNTDITKNITNTVTPTEAPKKFLSILSHGNRKLPEIALTFDADMTPYMKEELTTGKIKSFYNKKIVDILEREKVSATIFMAGMWAEEYPDVAKKLAQDPLFEIANHSYSHPRFEDSCFALPPVPSWGKEGEFQKSQESIEKNSGIKPTFFRFPGGCHSDEDVKMANKYGLTVVDWDDASGDSFNTNLPSIIKKIETNTQNGSILLFHFHGTKDAPYSAEALQEVIPFLKQRGFKFVKMSELVAHLEDQT